MHKFWFMAAAAVSSVALPAIAEAAPAFSTANVNMRSGPSTRYPAVFVVPAGSRVDIRGCLSSANWCDVSVAGYRGWISGSYLQTSYSQRRVYVEPEYYRPLGIPTVTFSVGRYWDDHYRGRSFYRERDRWSNGPDWRDDNDRRDRDRDRDWRSDNDRRDRDRDRDRDWRGDNDRRQPDRDWRDGDRRDEGRRDDRRREEERRPRPERAQSGNDRDNSPLRRMIEQKRCKEDPNACR